VNEFHIRIDRSLFGSPVVVVTHVPTGLIRISAFDPDIERATQRCIESLRKRLEELRASSDSGTSASRRSADRIR
jgi:hypothetical protein